MRKKNVYYMAVLNATMLILNVYYINEKCKMNGSWVKKNQLVFIVWVRYGGIWYEIKLFSFRGLGIKFNFAHFLKTSKQWTIIQSKIHSRVLKNDNNIKYLI